MFALNSSRFIFQNVKGLSPGAERLTDGDNAVAENVRDKVAHVVLDELESDSGRLKRLKAQSKANIKNNLEVVKADKSLNWAEESAKIKAEGAADLEEQLAEFEETLAEEKIELTIEALEAALDNNEAITLGTEVDDLLRVAAAGGLEDDKLQEVAEIVINEMGDETLRVLDADNALADFDVAAIDDELEKDLEGFRAEAKQIMDLGADVRSVDAQVESTSASVNRLHNLAHEVLDEAKFQARARHATRLMKEAADSDDLANQEVGYNAAESAITDTFDGLKPKYGLVIVLSKTVDLESLADRTTDDPYILMLMKLFAELHALHASLKGPEKGANGRVAEYQSILTKALRIRAAIKTINDEISEVDPIGTEVDQEGAVISEEKDELDFDDEEFDDEF